MFLFRQQVKKIDKTNPMKLHRRRFVFEHYENKVIQKNIFFFQVFLFCFVLSLDLLRSFKAEFEFNENNDTNKDQPLGKINVKWTVSDTTNISHFVLEWHSSQDLRPQQKTVPTNETSMLIGWILIFENKKKNFVF